MNTSPMRTGAFIGAGLAIAFALAFFVSPLASSKPDGLNKVSIDEGFDRTETPHALGDTPTAGYRVEGVEDEGLSTGTAGLLGVAVTFAVCGGLVLVMRRIGGAKDRGSRSARVTTGSA